MKYRATQHDNPSRIAPVSPHRFGLAALTQSRSGRPLRPVCPQQLRVRAALPRSIP